MSTTDSEARQPMHSSSTSDDQMETKLAYEPDELTWKDTLRRKFSHLADDQPEADS